MGQPLHRIRELIKELPGKDSVICQKFLEERDFESIMEITQSDIFKVRKSYNLDNTPEGASYIDETISKLLELKANLEEYMSFLEVPDNSDDLYNDCCYV